MEQFKGKSNFPQYEPNENVCPVKKVKQQSFCYQPLNKS